jgi:hypothetical protein
MIKIPWGAFFGPPKFCSFSFLSYLLDGSVVAKERVPSPKLLWARALGEHLCPMFMLLLCLDTFFLCSWVCNLVFMCTPSCVFWAFSVLLPFSSFLFARVGVWWLRQKCHYPSFFKRTLVPLVCALLVSMFFPCLCVCSLMFLCVPLHVFWALIFCSPFFPPYLQGWERNGWGRSIIT